MRRTDPSQRGFLRRTERFRYASPCPPMPRSELREAIRRLSYVTVHAYFTVEATATAAASRATPGLYMPHWPRSSTIEPEATWPRHASKCEVQRYGGFDPVRDKKRRNSATTNRTDYRHRSPLDPTPDSNEYIAHVDVNSLYVSCERTFDPTLIGRPGSSCPTTTAAPSLGRTRPRPWASKWAPPGSSSPPPPITYR
jgi:hypothetical protein